MDGLTLMETANMLLQDLLFVLQLTPVLYLSTSDNISDSETKITGSLHAFSIFLVDLIHLRDNYDSRERIKLMARF